MKKYLYILAALSLAPNFALAQSLDSEVDTELDQIAAQQMVAPEAAAVATERSSVTQQPIYILNQGSPIATSNSGASSDQGQLQAQVQKQPTTVIVASPLTESRAEQIRRARQDAEVQTEQKIVEKLEVSRMEDEKRRAAILFGDKFSQTQQQQQIQVQQVQQTQQPVVIAAPVVATPIVVEPQENTRDIVREEIRAAMRAEDEIVEAPLESRYFGAMVGVGDYPSVRNVRANYSLGAQFGTKYDNFIVEGTFQYSDYNVDSPYANNGSGIPQSVEVSQYSGALAAKYEFFGGMIRPIVGGLVQYSYRNFAWADHYGFGYTSNSNTATSHAIDVGAVLGTDLVFTPKFTLGMDFRYLWNLASRVNTNNVPWMTGPQYGTPIEKLSYYVLSIVGKVNF